MSHSMRGSIYVVDIVVKRAIDDTSSSLFFFPH